MKTYSLKQVLANIKHNNMDEATWRNYAKVCDGTLFVWVDQGTDSLLKDQNSGGVCFAMAHDFVTAFQAGQPGPLNFCTRIRNASQVPPKTSRVPPKYVHLQRAYQAMTNQYNQNQERLEHELQGAEKADIQAKQKQYKEVRIKQKYGAGMASYEEFEASLYGETEIFNRMNATTTKNGPSYFLVDMNGPSKTGHSIAFGFRPDLSFPSFPAIYEFFDANLGYFLFKSEDKLSAFFAMEVWERIYRINQYSTFNIASFTAKKGMR